MSSFTNEPLLELRRARVRTELADALATLDQQLPWRVPVIDRRRPARRADAALGRPWPAGPHRRARQHRHAQRRRPRRQSGRTSRPGLGGQGRPRARRDHLEPRPPASCADGARCSPPWPFANAGSRGPRPTATSARRSTSSSTTRSRRSCSKGRTASSSSPGERNTLRYAARGVVAVVGPWNFPLAIPAGMVAAGLATGNGVVLKPAEQSPGCALAIVEAFHAAGVPHGALNLLPGEGATGAALVAHPGVHTIAFTGSGAVGLSDPQAGRGTRPRPEPPQARRRRDGRQELRDRRRRRRPRRRRPRPRLFRLRVRRPEVLRGRPRTRPRADRRARCSSACTVLSRRC